MIHFVNVQIVTRVSNNDTQVVQARTNMLIFLMKISVALQQFRSFKPPIQKAWKILRILKRVSAVLNLDLALGKTALDLKETVLMLKLKQERVITEY